MSDCVKETMCTRCEHRTVYKLKRKLMMLVSAVKDAVINTDQTAVQRWMGR